MKTQQEIVIYAVNYAKSIGNEDGTAAFDYAKGYNQCQEDMKKDVEYWQGEFDHWHQQAMEMADKKYTEEDLMNAFNAGINNDYGNGPSFDKWLNSLNKQD